MKSRREYHESRLAALKAERATWEPVWRDIGEQLVPYRLRLDHRDRNRGERKDSKIINSRPVMALRTLAAGMMASITSPARDWFRLSVSDPDLADYKPVRLYLDDCQTRIQAALHGSNFYKTLSSATYPDMIGVATHASFMEEGRLGAGPLARFRSLEVGEYCLDVNADGVVDVCYRELAPMTVRQAVQKFGYDNLPSHAREAWDRSNYHHTINVCHAVTPNEEYSPGKLGRHGMRYASCWWSPGDERKDFFMREEGYHEFPILAPRWSAKPTDAYGRGPGWDVRGDCRQLQQIATRKLQVVDKIVNPPMKASGNIRRLSLLPGDVTRYPRSEQATAEPIITMDPRALEALNLIERETEDRIAEALFQHFWNMLLEDERKQRPTATEVEARRQEVALMLGPLLENLNDELLEPVVERMFAILDRNGLLPEPPPELEAAEMKVEFISIMHQMQQSTGLVSIRTLMGEVHLLAQVYPEVLDKIDADAIVDDLARITGVKPETVLSKDEVEAKRAERAQRQQVAEQGQAMLALTQGAKNLGSVDPQKLADVAGIVAPAAAAQGGALAPATAA